MFELPPRGVEEGGGNGRDPISWCFLAGSVVSSGAPMAPLSDSIEQPADSEQPDDKPPSRTKPNRGVLVLRLPRRPHDGA